MALALQQKGVFSWHEWAETLGDEIKKALAAGDPDDGSTYYFHWLATLERLVATKGIASSETLQRYYHAWDHAADRTPHGTPIVLEPSDFPTPLANSNQRFLQPFEERSNSELADRAQTY